MTTSNRPTTETDELREILAEFNVHRELETTGRCVCGNEWPCFEWARQCDAEDYLERELAEQEATSEGNMMIADYGSEVTASSRREAREKWAIDHSGVELDEATEIVVAKCFDLVIEATVADHHCDEQFVRAIGALRDLGESDEHIRRVLGLTHEALARHSDDMRAQDETVVEGIER